nr:MAG TPA: hypothetical protein [Crassvirales sp.]
MIEYPIKSTSSILNKFIIVIVISFMKYHLTIFY